MAGRIIELELVFFVYGLAAIVAVKALAGGINFQSLLRSKADGQPSPARVQLLIATLVGAVHLWQVMHGAAAGPSSPSMDDRWLALTGGSSGIYWATKFYGLFKG